MRKLREEAVVRKCRYERSGVLYTAWAGGDGRRQETKVENRKPWQANVVRCCRHENRKVPVHSRRAALEPTRPADDIDRRPEVPAGVGQTVNMYSGEARESQLAGIATNDGGSGVLHPSFRG